ncbi:MAG: DUF59 domain-containing protein [Gammaproteobacteria bacterium]|nr:MAG: DUF59 domain-containing protein [Gammaproteobacteria bacterium]
MAEADIQQGAWLGPDEVLARAESDARLAAIVEALRGVFDPEIPLNIFDLGLVYGLRLDAQGRVGIRMTLTSPACPVAGSLPGQVQRAVAAVPGVEEVAVELVWDPPWSRERIGEAGRLELGIY